MVIKLKKWVSRLLNKNRTSFFDKLTLFFFFVFLPIATVLFKPDEKLLNTLLLLFYPFIGILLFFWINISFKKKPYLFLFFWFSYMWVIFFFPFALLSFLPKQIFAFTTVFFLFFSFPDFRKTLQKQWRQFFFQKTTLLLKKLLFSIIFLFLMFMIFEFFIRLINLPVKSENQKIINEHLNSLFTGPFYLTKIINILDSVLAIILLGPILEEVTFRLGYANFFQKSIWCPFVFSSLVFVVFHVSSDLNIANFLAYFCLSLSFGAVFFFFGRNIFYSTSIHVLWNTFLIFIKILEKLNS